jgi:2-oxoglutarate ferredoxin oxidoreductase subunit beta
VTAIDEGVRHTLNGSAAPAVRKGLSGVPLSLEPLNRKDFTSDPEVRWCPGCGDYAVLAAFQAFMPELGIKKENTVIVSGIGCSSRFP